MIAACSCRPVGPRFGGLSGGACGSGNDDPLVYYGSIRSAKTDVECYVLCRRTIRPA